MNIKIQHRNIDILSTHQKLIDRQCKKIQKLIPTFAPDAVDLSVNLERLPRGSQYKTALTLALPQRSLRVEEIEDNPTSSVVRAFEELRRRIQRFKSQLNREKLWHKKPAFSAEEPPVSGWELENLVGEHLEKIENFIRRELYHQVIAGTMPPGVLEPHALVDEVFLEATSNIASKPGNLPLDNWMFQLARNLVRTRINEVEAERNQPHMEESAGPLGKWEDEDLNFFQPDESLQYEDLLEDGKSSNPEELLERDEVATQLQRAVANLPDSLRESFVLFALEGFTSDEVAMMTGKTSEAIVKEVESARNALRRELRI